MCRRPVVIISIVHQLLFGAIREFSFLRSLVSVANQALRNRGWVVCGLGETPLSAPTTQTCRIIGASGRRESNPSRLTMYLPSSNFLFSYLSLRLIKIKNDAHDKINPSCTSWLNMSAGHAIFCLSLSLTDVRTYFHFMQQTPTSHFCILIYLFFFFYSKNYSPSYTSRKRSFPFALRS